MALAVRDPDDFPVLYRAADAVSLSGQRRYLWALSTRLLALLLAALFGAVAWDIKDVSAAGIGALIAFLVALAAGTYLATTSPERAWYEGRAAAESAKTLTWRYLVRGEALESSPGRDGDSLFLERLKEILRDLDEVDLAADAAGDQITAGMRAARAAGFDERKALYLSARIREQQRWYQRKAVWNRKRAECWTVAAIAFEVLGVLAGAARVFLDLDIDLLGILAAAAATVTAWLEAKQHRNLATAYGIAAQELASAASLGEAIVDEEEWAAFVGQAEEAISREHTLWRASRGIRT